MLLPFIFSRHCLVYKMKYVRHQLHKTKGCVFNLLVLSDKQHKTPKIRFTIGQKSSKQEMFGI